MKYLLLFFVVVPSWAQLISPCPRLFKYDPSGQENDRWYGTITLLSDSELSGVRLRLIFDKPFIQLGNWFGKVVTTDNKEYLVKNDNYKLLANTPFELRFYVKYNPNEIPPKLKMFQLNGRTVCPENGVATEAPVIIGQLMNSSLLSTTQNPRSGGNYGGGDSFAKPGGSGFSHHTNEEDDDFFQGNFAIFNSHKFDGETDLRVFRNCQMIKGQILVCLPALDKSK